MHIVLFLFTNKILFLKTNYGKILMILGFDKYLKDEHEFK